MKLHREGSTTIFLVLVILLSILTAVWFYGQNVYVTTFLGVIAFAFFFFIVHFFRDPKRNTQANPNQIIAPADGKVVVIEKTNEGEYLKDERIQLSVFMSPLNVHVNRNPVSGDVSFFKYHPGKYLVAWHPKSSTENERTTVVYKLANGTELLVRQIAGAVARRIKWYVDKGSKVTQGEEFGFIKFGSRVDLFLPLDAKILVNKDEKVIGGVTVLAEFA